MAFIEKRSVIKFHQMLGKYVEETLNDLQTIYKDDCPSKLTEYYWLRQFKYKRHSVEDDKPIGRPVEISDNKNEKCEILIRDDRRIKVQDLTHKLKVSKGSYNNL